MKNNDEVEMKLREGLVKYPEQLDSFGDPTFLKELLRLLLSQNRFEEAYEITPIDDDRPNSGWHHILFARALQKSGRREDSMIHWRQFLKNRPHHQEARQALDASAKALPKPLSHIATKVPKQPFEVIFDVGANVGQSCIPYAEALPNAEIFAFEPVVSSFMTLVENCKSAKNIRAFNIGLSDEEKVVHISSAENSTMNRIINNPTSSSTKITTETINNFVIKNAIPRINFLKIDTEGHDLAVLKGCGPSLEIIDFVQCECSANAYNTFHTSFVDIFNFMTLSNFYLFIIDGQTPEWSNGGFPVLRRFDAVFINKRVAGNVSGIQ